MTPYVHIRAIHLTELRSAIQDLWTREGMETIPTWSFGSAPSGAGGRPISARDRTDLRSWIQAYRMAATCARSTRIYSFLGGYSFWLLADPTNTTPGAVAVDASGNIRIWFDDLIAAYNGQ